MALLDLDLSLSRFHAIDSLFTSPAFHREALLVVFLPGARCVTSATEQAFNLVGILLPNEVGFAAVKI